MKHSLRRTFTLVLAVVLTLVFVPIASASSTPPTSAADKLHTLGMLTGTGTNPDGTINYGIDATLNRAQAVTLIVNLLGKYDEATSTTWTTPFTDVPSWALPFVGYAYANKITSGLSETRFGSTDPVLPKQYLTFVLNALGYAPGTDFTYDKAWEKSDALGFTNGRINAQTTRFLRGDAISVTFDSLSAVVKSTQKPLYEKLIASGVFTKEQATFVGIGLPPVIDREVIAQINAGQKQVVFGKQKWRVLSVEFDKALLVTQDIIDLRPYHDDDNRFMTWEICSLRYYLNTEFINTFSAGEKSQILTTHVYNPDNGQVAGGNNTYDQIFLLSADEAKMYFTGDSDRVTYLKGNGLAQAWWLRSPGGRSYKAAYIGNRGTIYQNHVTLGGADVFAEHLGVRPALYISLNQ
jgi:hypothetical protein